MAEFKMQRQHHDLITAGGTAQHDSAAHRKCRQFFTYEAETIPHSVSQINSLCMPCRSYRPHWAFCQCPKHGNPGRNEQDHLSFRPSEAEIDVLVQRQAMGV